MNLRKQELLDKLSELRQPLSRDRWYWAAILLLGYIDDPDIKTMYETVLSHKDEEDE